MKPVKCPKPPFWGVGHFQAKLLTINSRILSTLLYREAEKRNQLIFICNFLKNQRISMQFSLLYLKMNGTRGGMNFTHLT